MDGWMDGWIDRWMDGWLDGWILQDKPINKSKRQNRKTND